MDRTTSLLYFPPVSDPCSETGGHPSYRQIERLLGGVPEPSRIIHRVAAIMHQGRLLAEIHVLLRRIADYAERIAAGLQVGERLTHHLAHHDDAAIRYAEMLVGTIGNDALLLDRHA